MNFRKLFSRKQTVDEYNQKRIDLHKEMEELHKKKQQIKKRQREIEEELSKPRKL